MKNEESRAGRKEQQIQRDALHRWSQRHEKLFASHRRMSSKVSHEATAPPVCLGKGREKNLTVSSYY
jgi:hypothetical protein